MAKTTIYLTATDDRAAGARRLLTRVAPLDYSGKTVYVKPNFNTADPAPGSTHSDTLDVLLSTLRAANPQSLTLGERCGPGVTAQVMQAKGIPELCEKYGVTLVNFEELRDDEWVTYERDDLHWNGNLKIPEVVANADVVVTTCCLKTHGFGGVFSNSMKLAVGMTPKDMMTLHGSQDMRRMIAEINLAYTPDLVLMDAVEVFTDGGPMQGTRKNANLMLLGTDRVALDVTGLAILRILGSNDAIMNTPIREQEQIARAIELGLGTASADEIEFVTDSAEGDAWAEKINAELQR